MMTESDPGDEKGVRTIRFSPKRGTVEAVDGGPALSAEDLRHLAETACGPALEEHDVPLNASVVLMPAIFLERVLADARVARARVQELLAERRTPISEDVAAHVRTFRELAELRVAHKALATQLRGEGVARALDALEQRARVAEDAARDAQLLRQACDVCAAPSPVVLVADARATADTRTWLFLCADHADAPEFPGARISLWRSP